MSTREMIKSAARQCAILKQLIDQAEQAEDPKQTALLYGMAKAESDNLSKSLRAYLGRSRPAHRLTSGAAQTSDAA